MVLHNQSILTFPQIPLHQHNAKEIQTFPPHFLWPFLDPNFKELSQPYISISPGYPFPGVQSWDRAPTSINAPLQPHILLLLPILPPPSTPV